MQESVKAAATWLEYGYSNRLYHKTLTSSHALYARTYSRYVTETLATYT